MKYINADKLLAEIERRREKCADIAADERNEEVAEYYRGKEVAYDETSALITSLQQEQPDEKESLEKIRTDAALIGFHLACGNGDKTIGECIEIWKPIIIDSIKQEYQEVDLEKACDAYCKVCGHYPHTVPTYICRHNCEYFDDFKALLNAGKK